jgi:hypothetical protein
MNAFASLIDSSMSAISDCTSVSTPALTPASDEIALAFRQSFR